MNKDTEEFLVIGIIGFLALMFLSNSSAASTAVKQAQIANSTDVGLANAAASVLNTGIADWS